MKNASKIFKKMTRFSKKKKKIEADHGIMQALSSLA